MKSVIISIHPVWCDKIARRDKTFEVRKNFPKLSCPFKVYIYRTQGTVPRIINGKWINMKVENGVIGEFVCDYMNELYVLPDYKGGGYEISDSDLDETCLTMSQLRAYGNGKPLFAWHISNLKLYDEIKPLSDFRKPFPFDKDCVECERGGIGFCPETCYGCEIFDSIEISKSPQSWCYVEERDFRME